MNELVRIAEFRSILQNYHLSEAALQTLSQTKLVLLVGPAGAGRNTLITELTKTGEYCHIVSDTTRELRVKDGVPIEQNGREYWFRSEEDVLAGLRRGEYIEAAIIHDQQVSGCNIREIEKAHRANQIAIKDIEPNGAHTIHALKPDTFVLFMLPPNFQEWQRRLRNRGTMEQDEYKRRMASAVKEYEMGLQNDYYRFIVHDTIQDAKEKLVQIVAGQVDETLQRDGRALAEQLLAETKAFLLQTA